MTWKLRNAMWHTDRLNLSEVLSGEMGALKNRRRSAAKSWSTPHFEGNHLKRDSKGDRSGNRAVDLNDWRWITSAVEKLFQLSAKPFTSLTVCSRTSRLPQGPQSVVSKVENSDSLKSARLVGEKVLSSITVTIWQSARVLSHHGKRINWSGEPLRCGRNLSESIFTANSLESLEIVRRDGRPKMQLNRQIYWGSI